MQIIPEKLRRPALYTLLAVALVGSSAFLSGSCDEIQVRDLESGLLRPATPEEAAVWFTEGGQIAKTALVASGHPEWYPFADIAVRIAILIYAIRFGQPLVPKPQASPTKGDV